MAKIVDISNIDLKPTFVTKPDMRFATTFLSNKYRDYAVRGEAITDKATGEIFIKRPADGRVVSFFQNKKYLYDLALEMNLQLVANPDFYYPPKERINACYVSTDYDLMSINDEKENNIMENDITIPNTGNPTIHYLRFPISKESNGFFLRATSRDSDRVAFSWATAQYNAYLKGYTGTNSAFVTESKKFETIKNWQNADATVKFKLDIYLKNTDTTPSRSYNLENCVKVNEESCIILPETQIDMTAYRRAEKRIITIQGITFDKLHFMLKHKSEFGQDIIDGFKKFVYPDDAMYVRYINICSFIDKSSDITLLNNEFLIALLDMPYISEYLSRMARLAKGNAVIYSIEKPTDSAWVKNTIWLEPIRHVGAGGVETAVDSSTDFNELEEYFSVSDINYYKFTKNENDTKDIYVKDVKDGELK